MTSAPHVAVVGAGILGASLAWHLAQAGAAVTVVDAGGGGGVATPRSWAWINASWGNDPAYARLRMDSMAAWRDLDVPGLAVNWCGGLLWDAPEPELRAFVAERQAQGYAVRLVDRAEALALEPALADPPPLAAHAAEEGAVEPEAATRALLADAQAHGARLRLGQAVAAVLERGGRALGLRLADGTEVAADHVILAAGAATPALAAPLGVAVPLDAPPGLLLTTEPAPGLLRGLVLAPEIHARALPDGRLLVGTDFGGTDPGTHPARAAAEVLAAVRRTFRGAEALRAASHAVGHRPTPQDGRPIAGEAAPGLTLCVTHSGVTLAPILGQLLAAEALGADPDPRLAPYRPARFQV